MKKHLLAAALLAAVVAPAGAYTTYLEPNTFWPEGRDVQVEAAFASQFFTPQVALASDFMTIGPNGSRISFERMEVAAQATTLEAELPLGGTYRITSGERLGRVATMVAENGQWRELREDEAPPEGAQTTTLQTVTVADVYITRGQVSRDVVDNPIGRLAIRPITHPNQVLVSQGFEVEILFDGAPMANTAVVLYGAGDADTDVDRYAVTDQAGRARFTFDAPGRYLIAARHRADAPPGAEAAVRSYTTTLTFEVLTELPEGYDVEAQMRAAEREAERRALRRAQ